MQSTRSSGFDFRHVSSYFVERVFACGTKEELKWGWSPQGRSVCKSYANCNCENSTGVNAECLGMIGHVVIDKEGARSCTAFPIEAVCSTGPALISELHCSPARLAHLPDHP